MAHVRPVPQDLRVARLSQVNRRGHRLACSRLQRVGPFNPPGIDPCRRRDRDSPAASRPALQRTTREEPVFGNLVGRKGTTILLIRQESAYLERLMYRLPGLNPGHYQAKWMVLSADDDITEGVVTFTVVTSPAPQ